MSNWIRMENMEEGFQDLHGIKPIIYCMRISNAVNKIKLNLNGKEVILQETIEKGLTKLSTLEYDNQTTNYKSVYDAEKAATEILRS